MLASATKTFVAVVGGAYILGQEAQPLTVTEEQARILIADGLIVLAEGESLPELGDAPQPEKPERKRKG